MIGPWTSKDRALDYSVCYSISCSIERREPYLTGKRDALEMIFSGIPGVIRTPAGDIVAGKEVYT